MTAASLTTATTRVEVIQAAIQEAMAAEQDTSVPDLVEATLEAFQRVDTVPDSTMGVILQVRAERTRQIEKGYDLDHDDEHGPDHLMRLAQGYQGEYNRDRLVKAAALLVAAVEAMDRQAEQAQQYPDDAEEPSA